MYKEIISLYRECKKAIKENRPENSLVSNCFYLKDGKILALRNPYGDSRHPYSVDGLTLWAYASGNIVINQSNFFIIPPTVEGKEPYINLYGGIKNKAGKYDFFSFFGNCDNSLDFSENYTVFCDNFCYYIRKIKHLIFAVKLMISKDKKFIISSMILNNSNKEEDAFISFYFNPLLTHTSEESEETKWFRTLTNKENYSEFVSIEDLSREVHLFNYAVLKNAHNGNEKILTSRRMDYVGDKNRSISQSLSLRNGCFEKSLSTACFVDMAAYGDIIKKTVKKDEPLNSNYEVSIAFSKDELEKLERSSYDLNSNNKYFENIDKPKTNNLKIEFGPLNEKYHLNNTLFNNFLKSVIKQVDYSATTKNSSLMLLGIRDVYQMMEASLIWNPQQVREKILESLSYLDISGRAPRQYSKETEGGKPLFDNREFIDQGQWIISTVYQYLAFTNDYSLLKEKCGYYQLVDRRAGVKLDTVETVYEHLLRIIDFLISNIDENTNCLKSLYGDWNDAVDGLGTSSNENEKFGNGVSVMATCHLYKNLHEMFEISDQFKGIKNEKYLEISAKIEEGLLKNAIISKGNEKRIVHGWGENKSFYVGSFDDVDHKNRHSSTSNSFFVISRLYEKHPELKETILKAYEALDSKYGLKTFDEYFDKKDAYQVGRIVNLPKGTAENAATYIHAGLFFVRALFMMNEGERAFEQIFKLIPITHERVSTSPYVMPNSYGENKELGIDGESMSDWYTGSSNTLLKAIVFDMFGIRPRLGSELIIEPTSVFPSDEASISLNIKHKKVIVKYKNNHENKRHILVNGSKININTINLSEYSNKIVIEIIN